MTMDPSFLTGHLVLLRPVREADRERIVAMRRTEVVRARWRGDDLETEFEADLADDELHQFAIELLGGEVVGMIQFADGDDPEYRHASVDLFVDPAHHRRGIATDAISTLVDHLFDQRDHHRLVIDPAADNEAAIRCYERVGFRAVGIMRSYERQADGSWADGLLMEMLRSDRR